MAKFFSFLSVLLLCSGTLRKGGLGVGEVVAAGSEGGPSLATTQVISQMEETALNWLRALDDAQRAKGHYQDFNTDERFNWHFIPRPRKGLPFKEMTPGQSRLAMALLASGLSQSGMIKATTIMSLEEVLKVLEDGKGPVRDPELYFFTVFGEPNRLGTWGWRLEGHHLAINVTIVDGKELTVTPSMFGSNPAKVLSGPRGGTRALGPEEDLGRALVRSFDEKQRRHAVRGENVPKDVLSQAVRTARPLEGIGIRFSELRDGQRVLLRSLVEEYVGRYRSEIMRADLARIQAAGWRDVQFLWVGGLSPGEPHYYRVQGPTFLLEYDNTQNNNNHVHSVWRDFGRDFGVDPLRAHFQEVPHR